MGHLGKFGGHLGAAPTWGNDKLNSMRAAVIAGTMFLFWLILSGHYTPWLVGSGVVMSIAVAAIALYMGYADAEGHPIGLIVRGMIYWPWLLAEMIKSALGVARLVLDPRLPISPTVVKVKSSQKTAVGLTTYANSITLTPGTISMQVSSSDREILVHGITRETAGALADGEMDRRVTWFEAGTA
jgi:multicomponent Na+:H+ antiporter subunit E